MPSPLNDLLQKMVFDFHKENEVHAFGTMADNIKNMFTEFEQKQADALEAFQDEILNYLSEQADKIRESGCEVCEALTPSDINDCCLFCNTKKER
jgi:hypothetical protein